MGLGRYVVDAIMLEGRSPSELARKHGLSRSWVYELLGRYRQGGYAALCGRSTLVKPTRSNFFLVSTRILTCPVCFGRERSGRRIRDVIAASRTVAASIGI